MDSFSLICYCIFGCFTLSLLTPKYIFSGLSKRGAKSSPALVGSVLPLCSICEGGKAKQTVASCFLEAGTMIQNLPYVYVYLVLFLFRKQSRKQKLNVCLKSGKVLSIVLLWRTLLLKARIQKPFYMFWSRWFGGCINCLISVSKIQSMSYKEMLIVWITREEIHMQNGYSLYFPLMKYFYQLLDWD